ncbi:MAG: CPBP family intramembrane metalloprotease [Bacteroidia bacterium]|nr:CPBP family intramembrane metalloprotease [Bacteroidia bacterium]
MKKLFQYLNKFYTDHFSWKEFIIALIFIVAFCFFKYYKYIPQYNGKISLLTSWWYEAYYKNLKFLFHFILYLSPLLIGYLVNSIVHRNWSFWKNPKFITLAIFGVLVFSFRSSISFFVSDWLDQHSDYAHVDWLNRIIGTIARGLFVFLVLFIYWVFTDKNNQPFYGFTSKGFDFKPYLVMLACMVPLIAAASTQTDFLTSYPRVQRLQSIDITIPSHWKFYAIYETLYGLDFFTIEFFFRGFMILAFVGIVGPKAIIPVAYMYVVIHWSKPMGELISSFFGGSLLGIISYYSKSIWGGIIVHVGIAWMMEIGAFISKYFFP